LRVEIDSRQVRSVERRPKDVARLLRQAWRARLEEPESQPIEALRDALEGRGIALSDVDPARVDDLLALSVETDAQWRLRRAATEVKLSSGLRFVRFQGLVLPENAPPGSGALADAAGTLLKDLLGNEAPAEDPLAGRLRSVAASGEVGAVVTGLELAPDLTRVTVQSVLWVRLQDGGWRPALSRPASVPTAGLPAGAGDLLANDPQVQSVFRIFEGLGAASPDMKRQALDVGAAVQQALGRSKSALERDIEGLALPFGR
jgi:hypothetical protein